MKKLIPVIISATPMFAMAAGLTDLITTVQNIINSLIPLFMIIATVVFLWGIIQYITAAGDEDKVKEGRSYIIYGLIGLFVMVSVWGLVKIIADTFGVTGGTIPTGIGQL